MCGNPVDGKWKSVDGKLLVRKSTYGKPVYGKSDMENDAGI